MQYQYLLQVFKLTLIVNYHPNGIAQTIKLKQTDLFDFIVFDLSVLHLI